MKVPYLYNSSKNLWLRNNHDAFIHDFFNTVEKEMKRWELTPERHGRKLSYRGSPFRFVWNGWNMFNAISKAEFKFVERQGYLHLEYRLNFIEFFLIASAFTPAIFPIINSPLWRTDFSQALFWLIALVAGIWAALYGLNIAVAVSRLEKYLKKIDNELYLKHSPELVLEEDEPVQKTKIQKQLSAAIKR